MMKNLLSFLVCSLFIIVSSSCFAGTGEQHEKDLELILLGQTLSEDSKDPKAYQNSPAVLFGYLEDAIYLCVDQMGPQGQEWLDELNHDFHVDGLPHSINDIRIPVAEHEKYTHFGWNYKYYPNKEKWALRQNILLATVSKVFSFPIDETKSGNNRYSEQCVEMSKLIYYIHILGDHSRNKFESTTQRIQLRNAPPIGGEVERGLINELRECVSKLFWEQRTSMKYNRLMVKLNMVRFRAWTTGEEDSEEKHLKIMNIAEDTLKYMQPQVRNMLLEKPFFNNVFHEIVINDAYE